MRFWFLAALAAMVLIAGLVLDSLRPPTTMRLAAGPSGGGYYQVAEQYRAILARDGIDLELVETSGSVENADLISKREVDAAILQGGIKVADPETETIGALFFEPMIFLVRKDSDVPGNPAL